MPADRSKREDYKPLGSPNFRRSDIAKPNSRPGIRENNSAITSDVRIETLRNPNKTQEISSPKQTFDEKGNWLGAEIQPRKTSGITAPEKASEYRNNKLEVSTNELAIQANQISVEAFESKPKPQNQAAKEAKLAKRLEKDDELLGKENWLAKHGHSLSYFGLFVFTFLVLFRPYETIPGLAWTASTAYYVAALTLAVYIPTQLSTEGNLTMMTTEVKAILCLTALGLFTMVFATDKGLAWETFNDSFIKAVLMFIVMINVVRTRARLNGLFWLALLIALYLAVDSIGRFRRGEFIEGTEEARVAVDVGGIFGNPNDMSLYMVMMLPIIFAMGLATKNFVIKIFLISLSGMMVFTVLATQSRGGFLGLIAVGGVMAWKFGRKKRLNVMIGSIFISGLVLLVAPGNTGRRVLSIFIPGLDPSGSRSQRSDLLEQSIKVTLRNPWGLGMGNFNLRSAHHLATHNAFTQISTELGIIGLVCYLVFLVSPLRKLGAIERKLVANEEFDWFYYLSIGLQAGIIGYMVSSFFASVAYNWFMYYLVAFAVAYRRIYQHERGLKEHEKLGPGLRESLGLNIKAV